MAEEDQEAPKVNSFANDGSFLEMFKKKMEEQKAPGPKECTQTLEKSESTRVIPSVRPREDTSPEDSQETKTPEPEKKPVQKPYQAIVGKRKAMMRSIELREKRKKRREEIEEQQSAEDQESKSSAWKAYMAEVKSYEAKNCTDNEGFKRPLVK